MVRSLLPILGFGLLACTVEPEAPIDPDAPFDPEYLGITTQLLEGDLVKFSVQMRGARNGDDVDAYAECAAAQYALIRGFGFARRVRSLVELQGDVWLGDAVYVISPILPDGLKTIDAEVTVANCGASGIPTV